MTSYSYRTEDFNGVEYIAPWLESHATKAHYASIQQALLWRKGLAGYTTRTKGENATIVVECYDAESGRRIRAIFANDPEPLHRLHDAYLAEHTS